MCSHLKPIPGGFPNDNGHGGVEVGEQHDRHQEEHDERDLVHWVPLNTRQIYHINYKTSSSVTYGQKTGVRAELLIEVSHSK